MGQWHVESGRPCVGAAAAVWMVWMMLVPILVAGQTTASIPQSIDQLAERASSGKWDTFSARVTIHRELVGGDGARVGSPAEESFAWERARTAAGGWKTTMKLVSRSRPTVQSRTGPMALPDAGSIERVEDNEDGSPPRFFNRAGVEIVPPSEAMRNRFRGAPRGTLGQVTQVTEVTASKGTSGVEGSAGIDPVVDGVTFGGRFLRPAQGREWIQSMVLSAAGRPGRLQAFNQAFGRRTGVVRGLGRYLKEEGDSQREVLVDDQNAVPVEINTVQAGALLSQTRFSYERSASGALVRHGIRVERLVSGQHLISEMTYSDVRLDQKGGR